MGPGCENYAGKAKQQQNQNSPNLGMNHVATLVVHAGEGPFLNLALVILAAKDRIRPSALRTARRASHRPLRGEEDNLILFSLPRRPRRSRWVPSIDNVCIEVGDVERETKETIIFLSKA